MFTFFIDHPPEAHRESLTNNLDILPETSETDRTDLSLKINKTDKKKEIDLNLNYDSVEC